MSDFLNPVLNDPDEKNLHELPSFIFILGIGIGDLIGSLVGGNIYDSLVGNVDGRSYPE